ncbi:MAG: prepilin-type N-terminal cleavage/methylation domain-containing protein [Phycisphaeraceae bacterium]
MMSIRATTRDIGGSPRERARHESSHGSNGSKGFSIIELMVVVSLIALLLGFSVPLVFKIDELSRDRSGVNSFGVGVTAARAYASRRIADNDSVPGAEYSGAALLVTNFNEMRVVDDVQNDALEGQNPSKSEFQDVQRMEPIILPRGTGVAGIIRAAPFGADVRLIPPPFAIRFNRHGQLVAGATDDVSNVIYYDGNYDGNIDPAKTRISTAYDPVANDPDLANVSGLFVATRNQYQLPIDVIECVVGVVVYSKADFEDAGGKFNAQGGGTTPSLGCKDGTCGNIAEWMFDNGTVLFFSRNTGAIIRTKRQ